MMVDLNLDIKTAERMGLPSAVASVRLPDQDGEIEVVLLPPGTDLWTSDWAVVVHFGCDPDRPDIGTSSVEEVPGGKEFASKRYVEVVGELKESLERDEQMTSLRSNAPM
jgi:hypothetical protein